jgi:replicative DNA helicase
MDKTKLSSPDATRAADEDITVSNQPTIRSEKKAKAGTSQTVTIENERDGASAEMTAKGDTTGDKTAMFFGKEDIRKKLQDELAEVPEVSPEDLEASYVSRLISTPFMNRTNEEKLRINRNFLRDAEPFVMEGLMDDIKKAPEELLTGFPRLDRWISIPQRKLTLVTGSAGHGKTVFMLNMILNMIHNYPEKHFLYYSYGEFKQDVQIKLINMCGETPFSKAPDNVEGINTNFKRWKYEFKTRDIDILKARAEKEPEYKGLKNFLEVSSRIHVIDTNYNITDLIDSIRAFNSTLPIGAVFIDYLQAVRLKDVPMELSRRQQTTEICETLVELSHEMQFPFIAGAQLAAEEKNIAEYDMLSVDYLKDIGDPKQLSNLIIGLQNYSKSRFIGSNVSDTFRSRFYDYTFRKAEKMPETFKDKHPNTVILAKVLSNRSGPEPEVELLFNKWLMKISDLEDRHLPVKDDKKVI